MMDEKKCQKNIETFLVSGFVFLSISLVLFLSSLILPLGVDLNPVGLDRHFGDIALSTLDNKNISLLESKITARLIIKAAQAQAAVRDTGLAKKLAKNLKLQGVVNMSDELTAYIRNTKEKRTVSVHEGEKVLDFIVKKIEQGSVTLVLDGVEVSLSH